MRALSAIFLRELRLYFISPIAPIVLVVFQLVTSFNFYFGLQQFITFSRNASQQLGEGPVVHVNQQFITPLFFNMAFTALFLLPLLTMRLFSEERKQGSMELLLTYPVSDLQVVLGKYLAALALYALMLFSTAWSMGALFQFGSPDPGPVFTGYLGLFLYGGALLALGLMLSALTENQIVAGALTFFLYLVLWLLGGAASAIRGTASRVIEWVALVDHFQALSQGIVDSADLIYFACLIVFGLFMSLQFVAAQRWSGD